MVIGTPEITALVAQHSRCICRRTTSMPCWKCHPDTFAVYWVAKWDKPPVFTTSIRPGARDDYNWAVLLPTNSLYPRTIRDRQLLGVAYHISYRQRSQTWDVTGSHGSYLGEDLGTALTKYSNLAKTNGRSYAHKTNKVST